MGQPSIPTIKRLFARSGNQCAFPKCPTPVEDSRGTILCEICHIKAQSPGGPRYDAHQSDRERHAYENLILLCPTHHKVVDDDEDTYTVERLLKMKTDHEARVQAVPQPPSETAQALLNVSLVRIQGGSHITTINQMGGQVAHNITNIGPQPRRFSRAAADLLVRELRARPNHTVQITAVMGDSEAAILADDLKNVLQEAGWINSGLSYAIFSGPVRGLIVKVRSPDEALEFLLNWLARCGFNPDGIHNADLPNEVEIVVGASI